METKNINNVLSMFSGAFKFECASKDEIDICNQLLLGFNKPVIPFEYVNFLQNVSNGLSLDGICLFGTNDYKNTTYSIPSLVTIADKFNDINLLDSYLIIGNFFNLYVVYNRLSNNYELFNLVTFLSISDYSSFETLFYELIVKRTDRFDNI